MVKRFFITLINTNQLFYFHPPESSCKLDIIWLYVFSRVHEIGNTKNLAYYIPAKMTSGVSKKSGIDGKDVVTESNTADVISTDYIIEELFKHRTWKYTLLLLTLLLTSLSCPSTVFLTSFAGFSLVRNPLEI